MNQVTHFPKRVEDRARQNLRLESELWLAIDAARLRRPGSVSRNTWIAEAIQEKIAREQHTDHAEDHRGSHA